MTPTTRDVLIGLGLFAPLTASAQSLLEDGFYGWECNGDSTSSELEAEFTRQGNQLYLSDAGTNNRFSLSYSHSDQGYQFYGTSETYFVVNADHNQAHLIVQGETLYTGCYPGGLACPFVYVHGADGPMYIGEILRNVIGKQNETTQTLELPAQLDEQGALRVRISEEKSEISFLDAVRLRVDDRTILADSCIAGELAWCQLDGQYHQMVEGDLLELRFLVGALPDGARVLLEASGYYVPMLQTVAR